MRIARREPVGSRTHQEWPTRHGADSRRPARGDGEQVVDDATESRTPTRPTITIPRSTLLPALAREQLRGDQDFVNNKTATLTFRSADPARPRGSASS